jgi:hypothetical protein
MSDIVERLRAANASPNTVTSWRDLVEEAADEIERLRLDNLELRAAIRGITDYPAARHALEEK